MASEWDLSVAIAILQLFKDQPQSIEFVYLRNAAPNSVSYNPYNLEIVPHADVKVQDSRLRAVHVASAC